MARIVTHFGRLHNQHRKLERKSVLSNLVLDTEEHPWWIIKYTITFRGIADVEARLKSAVQDGHILWENTVRHGRKGHQVRDVVYLWCPSKKFAIRFTKFVNSSPHYLEVTGDLRAARRTLSSWGI